MRLCRIKTQVSALKIKVQGFDVAQKAIHAAVIILRYSMSSCCTYNRYV
jgi:hypothetical protein